MIFFKNAKSQKIEKITFYSLDFGLLNEIEQENISSLGICNIWSISKFTKEKFKEKVLLLVHCDILNYEKIIEHKLYVFIFENGHLKKIVEQKKGLGERLIGGEIARVVKGGSGLAGDSVILVNVVEDFYKVHELVIDLAN